MLVFCLCCRVLVIKNSVSCGEYILIIIKVIIVMQYWSNGKFALFTYFIYGTLFLKLTANISTIHQGRV